MAQHESASHRNRLHGSAWCTSQFDGVACMAYQLIEWCCITQHESASRGSRLHGSACTSGLNGVAWHCVMLYMIICHCIELHAVAWHSIQLYLVLLSIFTCILISLV